MHCVNLYSDIALTLAKCQMEVKIGLQIHKTELLNLNVWNWVWYSLLNQFMKEKISDKFYHIGKWSAKVYRKQRGFLLWLSVAPKMSFIAPTRKCEEQNLTCTALICINALHTIFWSGSQCPKVETIKNTISICLDLICLWDHEFKINIKLIMNQNAMLICAITFVIHIV